VCALCARGSRQHSSESVKASAGAANRQTGTEVGSQKIVALYVALMAAVIVGIDLLFFKNRFWLRLTVNVGIVLVFVGFYFRFLKRR
jgi:type IV secretory pathway VirB2 component (pilin)